MQGERLRWAPCCVAAAAAAAVAWAGPAGASQIDLFEASATQVVAGSTVSFSALYSLDAYATSFGGSNPNEPAPEEGPQTWDINWYGYDRSTLTGVWLQAGGDSDAQVLQLAPGEDHAGGWQFDRVFDQPGVYDVVLEGGWSYDVEYYYSSESAYRDCWYDDPDQQTGLQCSPWTYEYTDDGWSDTYTEAFDALTLTITVTPVPEPATWALWGAGLVALRRWRAAAAGRPGRAGAGTA